MGKTNGTDDIESAGFDVLPEFPRENGFIPPAEDAVQSPLSRLFTPLNEKVFKELEQDIKINGVQNPVVAVKGPPVRVADG